MAGNAVLIEGFAVLRMIGLTLRTAQAAVRNDCDTGPERQISTRHHAAVTVTGYSATTESVAANP
jgi:hypothetical protein